MAFAGVDFVEFDSLLNDEEKLVRSTARQFVDNEVLPIIEKHNREATFPMHVVPRPGCNDCVQEILHIRHYSLFAPRDFDISPYFQVVKPTLDGDFDYKSLVWDRTGEDRRPEQPATA